MKDLDSLLKKVVKDKVLFIKTFFVDPDEPSKPFIPYDFQEKMLRDDSALKVYRLGRQTGKTTMMALEPLYYMLTRPNYRVVFVAPEGHQVLRYFERYLLFFLQNSVFSNYIETKRRSPTVYLALKNGSALEGFVGNAQQTDIRGVSADMIVIDECFDKFTYVITPKGKKYIYQIKPGDYVLDASGKWTKVLEARSTGLKKTIALKTFFFDKPIYVTPDHPFYYKEGWVEVSKKDTIPIFVGVHDESINEIDLLAIHYYYLLIKSHQLGYIRLEYKEFNVNDKYLSYYLRFKPDIEKVYKTLESVEETVRNLGEKDKKRFIRTISVFLCNYTPAISDILRELGYEVRYGQIVNSNDKFVYDIGIGLSYNNVEKVLALSEKLNIPVSDIYDSDNFDIKSSVYWVKYEFSDGGMRDVYNLKTESGTYMVYHEGFYIPVHNCDYLHDKVFRSIGGTILGRRRKVRFIVGSTPTAKKGYFWSICQPGSGFSQHHYPSWVLPHWTWMKDAEKLGIDVSETLEFKFRQSCMNDPIVWKLEVEAEFVDTAESVFSAKDIDYALQSYNRDNSRAKRGPIFMGIDWNSVAHGIVVVLLEWDNKEQVLRYIYDEQITKEKYHHIYARERIIDIVNEFNVDYIYADYGYGEQNMQELARYGEKIGDKRLVDIVPVVFNRKIDIFLGWAREKFDIKQFLVTFLNSLLRGKQLQLNPEFASSKNEEFVLAQNKNSIEYQLRNYQITKITPEGHIKYDVVPDHHLMAMFCALYGFWDVMQPEFDPTANRYKASGEFNTKYMSYVPIAGIVREDLSGRIINRTADLELNPYISIDEEDWWK